MGKGSTLAFIGIVLGLLYTSTFVIYLWFFIGQIELFLVDPVESLILVLIGVIYLRGSANLLRDRYDRGRAFLFVGTIIAFLVAMLDLLNLLINGLVGAKMIILLFSGYNPRVFPATKTAIIVFPNPVGRTTKEFLPTHCLAISV